MQWPSLARGEIESDFRVLFDVPEWMVILLEPLLNGRSELCCRQLNAISTQYPGGVPRWHHPVRDGS
jgi:hypothetical protein